MAAAARSGSRRRGAANGAANDLTILDASFRDHASWASWRVCLAAMFGLPIESEADLAIYRRCTGRDDLPTERAKEAWLICGRRSGKSFVLALIAVWLAAFVDWKPLLTRGEKATILVIAADRRQASVVLGYVRALLEAPLLRQLVLKDRIGLFHDPGGSWRRGRGFRFTARIIGGCEG
jgi:hypothetical protein